MVSQIKIFVDLKKEVRDWNAEILRHSADPKRGGMVPSYAVFGLLDTYETLATLVILRGVDAGLTNVRYAESFKPLLKKMIEEEAQSIKKIINSEPEMYFFLIELCKKWEINVELKEKEEKKEEKEDGGETEKP